MIKEVTWGGLGLCASGVALAEGTKVREINIDYHDKYWEAQAHIDKLEEQVQEMANHRAAMKINEKFGK